MKKENNTTINNDLNKKLAEIKVTKAPAIYGENSEDNLADRKQKTFLTEKNIRDYIHYQKKNNIHSFDDVQMLVYHHPKNDGYIAKVKQTIESLITTELANKDSQGKLVRKVLFNRQKNAAHIGCFVILIDKSINPPEVSLFCPDADRPVASDVDLPEAKADLTRYSLGIQKDKKSCGITALKMAKHLTPQWYQDNKTKLKNIVQENKKKRPFACFHNLPFNIYPEKLQAYQQGNADWIASNHPQVALENANKGYIQLRAVKAKDSTGDKTENKNENSTNPNANTNKKSQKVEFKYQNVKLQESKIRRLYENYYQQEKKKLDKKDQKYRSQKQKIIKEIRKKFNNDQLDIHNSSINKEDEKFLTYINA